MREKIRDRGRLEHIIEQLHNIDEFLCDKSFEDLQNDKILQYAVIKSVEIIGEASYMLSSAFKEQHTEIAWNEIVKMRHVLVHGYSIFRFPCYGASCRKICQNCLVIYYLFWKLIIALHLKPTI